MCILIKKNILHLLRSSANEGEKKKSCLLPVYTNKYHQVIKNMSFMRKIFMCTVAVQLVVLSSVAQPQMKLTLQDGSVFRYGVSDVKGITWTKDSVSGMSSPLLYPAATGEVLTVSPYTARIGGKVMQLPLGGGDFEAGILFSKSLTPFKDNSVSVPVETCNADGSFALDLKNLDINTVYSYRTYVCQNGMYFYGQTRQFSTLSQSSLVTFSTGQAKAVTCYSARLILSALPLVEYKRYVCGVAYDTLAAPENRKPMGDNQGEFEMILYGLYGDKEYHYRPYVEMDGKIYYGEEKTFRTAKDNVVQTGMPDEYRFVTSTLDLGDGDYKEVKPGMCYTLEWNGEPTLSSDHETIEKWNGKNDFRIYMGQVGQILYRAYVEIDGVAHYGETKRYYNGLKGVDLGLSINWAPMNVGAENVFRVGSKFAWGETEPKTTGSWENYRWYDSSINMFTKYCTDARYGTVDNKTQLDRSDDAAYINWGRKWRMPTEEELRELITQCEWKVEKVNGIDMLRVTGPNGNYIFFSAVYGRHWTIYLSTTYNNGAKCFNFDSQIQVIRFWNDYRNIPYFIRAVQMRD